MPIRLARPLDLAGLAALDAAVFGAPTYPLFFFRQALDLWPGRLWVADGDGTLRGYALTAPGDDGATWLLSVAVAPEARGTGIGAELIEAALAPHPGRARLTVDPRSPARRLYERLGFSVEALLPDHFGPGEDRCVMVRG